MNDKIINASQQLLRKQYPQIGGLQNTLLGQNLSFSVERAEFVQVLHASSHWLCISTIDCKMGEVKIFDSLYTSVPAKVVRQIAALIHSETPELRLLFLDIAQQRGSSECGLYAIANATSLCAGIDPTTAEFIQDEMRSHVCRCLEEGVLFPFPFKKRVSQSAVKSSQEIELHCHCWQPSYGKMILCIQCGRWFHNKCEMVTAARWKNPKSWRCRNCV